MPKELRKRGKRAKKTREEDAYVVYAKPDEKAQHLAAVTGQEYHEPVSASAAGAPSHIHPDRAAQNGNEAASMGVYEGEGEPQASTSLWPAVDPDTKGYFRQLEDQIIEFEELHGGRLAAKAAGGYQDEDDELDVDDRVLLLRAALTQLSGKEAPLAADPEMSPILERLVYSMDDFARRVLLDRFAGQYCHIAQDRFASHVLQALIVLGGGETVERERRGIIAKGPDDMGTSDSAGEGQLPTMTESIVAMTKELIKDLSTVIKAQHGSYVVRALLLVLGGRPLPFDSQNRDTSRQSAMGRSKKSAHWKSQRKGGDMRSFLPGNNASAVDTKGKGPEKRIVPRIFEEALAELFAALDVALSGSKNTSSEIAQQQLRLSSDDPIATGLIQIMLDIEHDQNKSTKPLSVMDRLLQGLITSSENGNLSQSLPRSDYIETLLRSNTSSHVLEKLVSLCPQDVFDVLFKTYFTDRVGRLAGHPVANFVAAKVVERANKEQTKTFVDEIGPALEGIIENSRTGVLKALLDKTAEYGVGESTLNAALIEAFQTSSQEDLPNLVPCCLLLMTLKLYKRHPSFADPAAKAEIQMQGSLVLQAWLRMKNNAVSKSLLLMPMPRLLALSRDPIASRVLDVFLDETNPAVTLKDRRVFLRNLIGHYHALADDRIGSRVAERCWQVADPFLKDKIADSLIPHEIKLQGSQFGHFFIRKVNIPLYKRNRDEWKSRQAQNMGGTPAELRAQQALAAKTASSQPAVVKQDTAPSKKRKSKEAQPDEIDDIFAAPTKKGKAMASL